MDKTDLSIEDYLAKHFKTSSSVFKKIEWLGILNSISIDLEIASPAEVLQKLLEVKWVLATEDKDMIVMQHQFEYMHKGKKNELHSSFVTLGEDQVYTGMSKTVGLPVGIAAKLILNGTITGSGVKVPVSKDIYTPVLDELEKHGIQFIEKEIR
jgi:saccharopine dehydrogenase (NADP+, L-glutamate forming)